MRLHRKPAFCEKVFSDDARTRRDTEDMLEGGWDAILFVVRLAVVGGITCVFYWLVSIWLDTTEGSWMAGYAFLPVLLVPLLMAGGAAGKTLGWFELPGGCLAVLAVCVAWRALRRLSGASSGVGWLVELTRLGVLGAVCTLVLYSPGHCGLLEVAATDHVRSS